MKSYNCFYLNKKELEKFVSKNAIVDNDKILIQIFTSITDSNRLSLLIKNVKALFSLATIIGATTDGEICSGEISIGKTVISITQFKKSKLYCAISTNKDSYKRGEELAKKLNQKDTKVAIVFSDGINTNGERLLKGIASINKNMIISGGMAGDNGKLRQTFLLTKKGITPQYSAIGVAISNRDLLVKTSFSFNWIPIGKKMVVTKSKDNRVYTIDNIATQEIYRHYLGEEVSKRLPVIGIEFPLLIKKDNQYIARAVIKKHNDGSLSFAGDLKVGSSVRFGHGDSSMILFDRQRIFRELSKNSIESIFIYSCMARRRFIPILIKREIEPLEGIAPTSGFFTYGEFYTQSNSYKLFNETMTILALSEYKKEYQNNRDKTLDIELDEYSLSKKALINLINTTTKELESEYKRLEEEKKIIEAKNEALKEAQAVGRFGTFQIDLKNHNTFYSDEIYNIFDISPKANSVEINTFLELICEDNLYKAKKCLSSIFKGNRCKTELRFYKKNRETITVLINVKMTFDDDGSPKKAIGTILDISEIVKLKEYNEELASIIEDSTSEIYIMDEDSFKILYANKSAIKALGYEREELLKKSILDINQNISEEKIELLRNQLIQNGNALNETIHIRKDGTTYPVQSYIQYKKYKNKREVIIFDINISELYEIHRRLEYQAYHDNLTGLKNRTFFEEKLIQLTKEHSKKFTLLFIDLDNFKQINDTLGHSIGDEVLKTVANRILQSVSKNDIVARIGGDEFTIILKDTYLEDDIKNIANRIINNLEKKITINSHELYTGASIGISRYPFDASNKEELIKFADTAMYRAKAKGKGQLCLYSDYIKDNSKKYSIIESDIRKGIENSEFEVYYQAIIYGKEKQLYGFETLLRWHNKIKGEIAPSEFIPIAEKSRVIEDLTYLVLKQAMQDSLNWKEKEFEVPILSINIPIEQIEKESFIPKLLEISKQYLFDLNKLEFEITESKIMTNYKKSIDNLQKLHKMGIKISIDDFGTGYSSLSHLKRLPIHKIKIDKSFILGLPNNDEDCTIVNTIVALAKSMNLSLLCEGVETKNQFEYLKNIGCKYFQGFYFAKPMPTSKIEKFLKKK